jgi:hypothetical protein
MRFDDTLLTLMEYVTSCCTIPRRMNRLDKIEKEQVEVLSEHPMPPRLQRIIFVVVSSWLPQVGEFVLEACLIRQLFGQAQGSQSKKS